MALQDEAYKLAELNMPYSREEYPNRDEYEDALEMEGEYQLMQMMTNPKYAPLRERYMQSIPKMTETDEFPQEFIDTYKGNPMEIAFRLLKAPRIPRKKGQPAGSKKHSDLYTDENPKGTIHNLGFKNPQKARQSVRKIKNSSRTHAHKTQAAIAMEQRAREMGKKEEAGIYRRFIEQQKKKTKEMNKAFDKAWYVLKQDSGTFDCSRCYEEELPTSEIGGQEMRAIDDFGPPEYYCQDCKDMTYWEMRNRGLMGIKLDDPVSYQDV
jgi:hypothetical protein